MTDSQNCCVCQKPNANLQCTSCAEAICKKCAQFVSLEDFRLSDAKHATLPVGTFCSACYDEKVASALDAYNEAAHRAGEIFIYYKAQSKENRFIRRKEKPIKVVDCEDRNEVILRLAFTAARMGFNCLVDVEVTSSKIINGGYQKSNWSALGIPVNADLERIRAQLKVTE